ncbi:MAG: hypothetical protein M1395_04750 [Bacteroidetes bacterium]|nr:hypothetical protein [Bacteroidota bacterium]
MKDLFRSSSGYTLVESAVAIVLFVTAVLGALNTMNSIMVSPRTKVLSSALVEAENELAGLHDTGIGPENAVIDNLFMKRTVTARAGYWEITVIVCRADNESTPLITVTKLVRFPYEE